MTRGVNHRVAVADCRVLCRVGDPQAVSGRPSDGRALVDRAIGECTGYRQSFGEPIPPKVRSLPAPILPLPGLLTPL